MDDLDFKILNIIQKGIPVTDKPYHEIAQELGIEPKKLVEKIKYMKDSGYIRRIGAIFDSSKMGYNSILIGMDVIEDQLYDVVNIVNGYDEITHNYYRVGSLKSSVKDQNIKTRLNVWFTLSTKNNVDKNTILDEISHLDGVNRLLKFPKLKLFKLKVFFEMGDSKCSMK